MAEEKKGFFSRLVAGLTKTRNAVVNGLDDIFNGPGDVDDDFYEELEETLITGDIGVRATDAILEDLRAKVKEQHIKQRSECRRVLIDTIKEQMDLGENELAVRLTLCMAHVNPLRIMHVVRSVDPAVPNESATRANFRTCGRKGLLEGHRIVHQMRLLDFSLTDRFDRSTVLVLGHDFLRDEHACASDQDTRYSANKDILP